MVSVKSRYSNFADLEAYLGDPAKTDSRLNQVDVLARDEQDKYPEIDLDLLDKWGLSSFYVPEVSGGRFRDFEETASLIRSVAYRDCCVALAHVMSFVASSVVWLSGTMSQKVQIKACLDKRERLALMLHEQSHGNDILAFEVEALATPEGYLVSGRKWMVGHAVRARTLILLAKTSNRGARGFSLFLIDKSRLSDTSWFASAPFLSHGVRGHELGNIEFNNARVDKDALLGSEGQALELILRCSQITRIVVTSLCLGAADRALRIATSFAYDRKLYGRSVLDLPHPRELITETFITLMICDCFMLSVTRALHVITNQASVFAAALKAFVPGSVERAVQELSDVLGARFFMRTEFPWNMFQKIVRDLPVARLAHFGSGVSTSHLASQIPSLVHHRKSMPLDLGQLRQMYSQLFDLRQPLPPFNHTELALSSRGRDDVMRGGFCSELCLTDVSEEARKQIEPRLAVFSEALQRLDDAVSELPPQETRGATHSPFLYKHAVMYSSLYAVCTTVQIWRHNRGLSEFFANHDWVVLALDLLAKRMGLAHLMPNDDSASTRQDCAIAEILIRLKNSQAYGVVPHSLFRANAN